MSGISLLWIDWKLAGKLLVREWLNRFAVFVLMGGYLLAMLASGGVNRFLSEQWVVNAVLHLDVSAAEGAGIAAKAEKLPQVRSVSYKDPEAAWKEFLADYPGLESLRIEGGNPVPGYLLVRLLPERLTAEDIAAVESALKPLPQVEKVFTGARTLPRLLKVREWVNLSLWGFFSLLAVVFFSILLMQESARSQALRADFDFLAERGISPRSIMLSRAAGSAILATLCTLLALCAAGFLLVFATGRVSLLAAAVGPIGDLSRSGSIPFVALFLAAVPSLVFLASLFGWRASNPRSPGK